MFRRVSPRAGLLAIALLLAGVACGPDVKSKSPDAGLPNGVSLSSSGSLSKGAPLPAPTGPVVLTVDGLGTAGSLSLDLETLAKMRTVNVDLYEPFIKTRQSFTGVLLSDLFDLVPVPANAQKLHLVALDDYVAEFTMSELRTVPMILATGSGGKAIPLEEGGPIRIVFPDDSKLAENLDLWIWSLRTVTIV